MEPESFLGEERGRSSICVRGPDLSRLFGTIGIVARRGRFVDYLYQHAKGKEPRPSVLQFLPCFCATDCAT